MIKSPETFLFELGKDLGFVPVVVQRKAIKNIYVRICKDLHIYVSVPKKTKQERICEVLEARKHWMIRHLEKFQQNQSSVSIIELEHGTSMRYLGRDVPIEKRSSSKEYVEFTDKKLCVYLKNTEDEVGYAKLFQKFWRKEAQRLFCAEMFEIFGKTLKSHGIDMPILRIRKMKSLWGSCTPRRNKITLNEHLLKAELECIQYVILHELAHLLYPHHNKDFYTFLSLHMHDWKARKERLNVRS